MKSFDKNESKLQESKLDKSIFENQDEKKTDTTNQRLEIEQRVNSFKVSNQEHKKN